MCPCIKLYELDVSHMKATFSLSLSLSYFPPDSLGEYKIFYETFFSPLMLFINRTKTVLQQVPVTKGSSQWPAVRYLRRGCIWPKSYSETPPIWFLALAIRLMAFQHSIWCEREEEKIPLSRLKIISEDWRKSRGGGRCLLEEFINWRFSESQLHAFSFLFASTTYSSPAPPEHAGEASQVKLGKLWVSCHLIFSPRL